MFFLGLPPHPSTGPFRLGSRCQPFRDGIEKAARLLASPLPFQQRSQLGPRGPHSRLYIRHPLPSRWYLQHTEELVGRDTRMAIVFLYWASC